MTVRGPRTLFGDAVVQLPVKLNTNARMAGGVPLRIATLCTADVAGRVGITREAPCRWGYDILGKTGEGCANKLPDESQCHERQ